MVDILQGALKVQPSLLPRRKAERLCIPSYKMMVHVILSYTPCSGALVLSLNVHQFSSIQASHLKEFSFKQDADML